MNRIDPDGADWYENDQGNLLWKEGSEEIEGYRNIGSSVSIQFGEDSYLNAYQNGAVRANKAVSAFDLIASSVRLQNLFLGKNSPLSEESKSALFNSLNNRSMNDIGRPIGQAIVTWGAGELGGLLLGKAIGWAAGKMAGKAAATSIGTAKSIKTANGIDVVGFTKHGVHRAIERKVNSGAALDALKNPLKIGNVVVDQSGRQSQRFIGKACEVVVNPQTGKIISINPTSSAKAARLLKQ